METIYNAFNSKCVAMCLLNSILNDANFLKIVEIDSPLAYLRPQHQCGTARRTRGTRDMRYVVMVFQAFEIKLAAAHLASSTVSTFLGIPRIYRKGFQCENESLVLRSADLRMAARIS